MIQSPIKTQKIVTLLTEPEARFVSLVDHGANQKPFRSLKSLTLDESSQPQDNMSKQDTDDLPLAQINKFEFDGSLFKTEDSVVEYLTQKGYSKFDVVKDDETFVVKGVDESSFSKVEAIKSNDDGVTIYVGEKETASKEEETEVSEKSEDTKPKSRLKKKESAETSDPKEPKESSKKEDSSEGSDEAPTLPEISQKFDYWMATYTDSPNIEEVLKAGKNGYPVGYYDIKEAFNIAIDNAFTAGDSEAVAKASTDFGIILNSFNALTESVSKAEGKEVAQKTFHSEPIKKTDEKTEVEVEEVQLEDVSVGLTAEDVKGIVAEIIKPVIIQMQDCIIESAEDLKADISSDVDGKITKIEEDAKENATKASDRLDSLESLKRVRKSDADPSLAGGKEKSEKIFSAPSDPQTRQAFGFR